jgi:histidinol dehydrogenase
VKIDRRAWDGAEPSARARELRAATGPSLAVEAEAAAIVADVRKRGDNALRELTARFDAPKARPSELPIAVPPDEVAAARKRLEPDLLASLEVAQRNIHSVAKAELEAGGDVRVDLTQGQTVTIVGNPVASAGVYVPGGRGSYPSTVLMCCTPARVAGVDRITVASPPGPDGRVNDAVLGTCAIAGVDEVYAVGGAQAIAAFAYGTATVRPVDLVVGPGNPYVNAAKRLVFGEVGVDGVAGPSELVVVLDERANARWLALDLLAQAEHGEGGLLVAISPDAGAIASLETELEGLAAERPTAASARISLVEAPELTKAVELSDALAPEHLELAIEPADARIAGDRVAGCVFFGPRGAVAFGDYAAGSNHVLPTGGGARFRSPLGVDDFRRRTSVVELPAEAAAGLAPRVGTLARAEGFPVHGESAEARAGD